MKVNRYREARKARGLKIYQAASELGVGVRTLYGYERGETEPGTKTLRKMAVLYQVSSDWLIGR